MGRTYRMTEARQDGERDTDDKKFNRTVISHL